MKKNKTVKAQDYPQDNYMETSHSLCNRVAMDYYSRSIERERKGLVERVETGFILGYD